MYLRHRRPTKADVIVFVLHDQWFKEPLSRLSPVEQVTDALGRTSYASRDQGWQREFGHLKTEVRAWSGNAIMARKAKTVLKHALIKGLSRSGIYHHQTGLAYLPYKKTRVIVERLPETVGEIAPGHGKFDRLVAGAIRLSEIAKQEKALLLTVIIPAKEYAYNRFQPKPVPLSGYGPPSRLNRALKEAGVQTVFTHPVLSRQSAGRWKMADPPFIGTMTAIGRPMESD